MSQPSQRARTLVYGPYFLLWCIAAWERSWTVWGLVQLVSLVFMLWGCGDLALRSWQRGGVWRFVGMSLGTVPWMTCAWLWAFHDTPMGPGVMTMLLTGTTMAWGYVISAFSYNLPISLVGGLLLWLGVLRIVFKATWPACLGVCALTFHGVSLWLVLVAYEDLPSGIEPGAIGTQDGVVHFVLDGGWDTARDLVLNASETTAYAGFMSSNRGSNQKRKPGIARIDLNTGLVTGHYQSRMGDTLSLDENEGVVWFSDFLDGHVRALDAATMQLRGAPLRVSPWPDGVARISDDALVTRVETPRRDDPELYWIYPGGNRVQGVDVTPHRWGHLNAAMEAVPSRGEVFLLQTGDDQTTLSAVSSDGTRASVLLPGIIWEASWDDFAEVLWLGSMTQNKVFKVNPTTLDYETFPVPNGIREIQSLPNGWLALADYLRGCVYLFDGKSIQKTIEVGRKPEAMALGPASGRLYILSDAGLTRVEL